jgi:hypothetical protein
VQPGLRRAVCVLVCAALTCAAAPRSEGSRLGIYFDEQATAVERTQEAPASATLWVLAVLGGDAASAGIDGAEFRVENFPSSWFANVVPNPAANIVLGGPLSGGVNIAFPVCQAPSASGAVTLFTVNYFAVTLVDHHVLQVEAHSTPNNPSFNCPLVVLCDDPFFTKLCVAGGRAAFNFPGFDQPAVETTTWSTLKALYE